MSGYDIGDDGLLRFRDGVGRRRLVVPQSMIPDILALVHTLQGHAGIGATVAIVSKHFFWKTPVKKMKCSKRFTPLQLDVFVALWHLYCPEAAKVPSPPLPRPGAPLSRSEALKLYPTGYRFWKDFGGGLRLQGQVFDYHDSYWKVRYSDHDWENLTRQELQRFSR